MTRVKPAPNLLCNSMQVPQTCNLPRLRTATLSPKISASSMKCVLMMMVLPLFSSTSCFHTICLLTMSTPELGSSSRITFGSPRQAMAMLVLLLIPPLRLFTKSAAFDDKPTLFKVSLMELSKSEGWIPFSTANRRRWSSTLRWSNRTSI